MNDPLEILLTWPYELRQKIADYLKPLCFISPHKPHKIHWIEATDNDRLRAARWALVRAVQYELGLIEDEIARLTTEQAENLLQNLRKSHVSRP